MQLQTNIKKTNKMKKEQILKQTIEANNTISRHENNAKTVNETGKTDPANVKQVGESKTVDTAFSAVQLKSRANQFLKKEHNSLNSVLRTIKENFNNVAVQDYIKMLQSDKTNSGANKTAVFISESDFEYNEVIQMLLYYTDENGKKVYSRLSKLKEEEEAQITYGDYSVVSGETINVEEHKSIDILVNNTHTLKAINGFSMWFILTLVVKVAKTEALSKKRATRLFNREISVYAKEHGLKVQESQIYCSDNGIKNIDTFIAALRDAKVFESLKFEKKAKQQSK